MKRSTLLLVAALALPAQLAYASLEVPKDVNEMTVAQKDNAVRPYFAAAISCIARSVTAAHMQSPGADVGDLIVSAVKTCVKEQRALVAAYDRYYGVGMGEKFFDSYVDNLPLVLHNWMRQPPKASAQGNH